MLPVQGRTGKSPAASSEGEGGRFSGRGKAYIKAQKAGLKNAKHPSSGRPTPKASRSSAGHPWGESTSDLVLQRTGSTSVSRWRGCQLSSRRANQFGGWGVVALMVALESRMRQSNWRQAMPLSLGAQEAVAVVMAPR
jgi:hypothetical protein